MSNQEPILTATNRFSLFPIKYPKVWQYYKNAEGTFWKAEDFHFYEDLPDWNGLKDEERFFIKNILAFFAASDLIVNINLAERFVNEVQIQEARFFYFFQMAMESIHSETYANMLQTYIRNPREQEECFNAIQQFPCVKRKAEWALKWIESGESFAERLVAFAAVEGIFFSGSFCAIYWLKERNLLHQLTASNESISRDEGLHRDFACVLYELLENKLDVEVIYQIIREAVEIEKEFITESLSCNLIGMNAVLMAQYIEYVADHLIGSLGYPNLYNTSNPFSFMDKIGLIKQDNFFEKVNTEYSQAGVNTKKEDHVISLDADF
jgi:ribonucleoside-diphosphate reductase beta chain